MLRRVTDAIAKMLARKGLDPGKLTPAEQRAALNENALPSTGSSKSLTQEQSDLYRKWRKVARVLRNYKADS